MLKYEIKIIQNYSTIQKRIMKYHHAMQNQNVQMESSSKQCLDWKNHIYKPPLQAWVNISFGFPIIWRQLLGANIFRTSSKVKCSPSMP